MAGDGGSAAARISRGSQLIIHGFHKNAFGGKATRMEKGLQITITSWDLPSKWASTK